MIDIAQIRREAEALDALCGGDEQLFADMLEGETDLHEIIGRIHDQRARDQEMLDGISLRQAALAERKQRIANREANAKALIGKILRAAMVKKVELPEATYSVRDGKPSLKVVDPDAVPRKFQVEKLTPNKRAINDEYDARSDLPNWLVREPGNDIITVRAK